MFNVSNAENVKYKFLERNFDFLEKFPLVTSPNEEFINHKMRKLEMFLISRFLSYFNHGTQGKQTETDLPANKNLAFGYVRENEDKNRNFS